MACWNTVAFGILLSLASGTSSIADAKVRHQAATHAQVHNRHRMTAPHRVQPNTAGHFGRVQRGKASVYAANLRGRRMADGTPFNPTSNAAASKTLPLGTTARVTNLKNGKTTMVRVRDRGPHRAGRIIDLSPGSASALGMAHNGIASVAIVPLHTIRTD